MITGVQKKSKAGIIKESGVVLNYLVLMIGLYAWDLNAFYVILSFVCEYVVVLLIVMSLTLLQGKSKLIKFMSALEILIGGLGLISLQGLLLFSIANSYSLSSGWEESIKALWWTVPAISLPMLIFHILPLRDISNNQERLTRKHSNLLTISVGFLGMGFIGLLTLECFEPYSIKPIMVVMIISRMVLEIYMNHFQKEKPKKIKS